MTDKVLEDMRAKLVALLNPEDLEKLKQEGRKNAAARERDKEKVISNIPSTRFKSRIRGVIPRPTYKKAKRWVIERLKSRVANKEGGYLSEFDYPFIEQLGVDSEMIPHFLESLVKDGTLQEDLRLKG